MNKTIRNATVALGAAAPTIVSEAKWGGQKRVVLSINNLNAAGGNDVFISVGDEAEANKGIRCSPGQTVSWVQDSAYIPPQDRITAYSAGATNVAVYEEVDY